MSIMPGVYIHNRGDSHHVITGRDIKVFLPDIVTVNFVSKLLNVNYEKSANKNKRNMKIEFKCKPFTSAWNIFSHSCT